MRPAHFETPDSGSGGMGVSFPGSSSVTRKLLWANGLVFAATFLLERFAPDVGLPVLDQLRLDTQAWYDGFPKLWQLWTYGFLHDTHSPLHILFNMLALYFFGTMLEAQVGSRRFLWQYMIALSVGALVHLALAPIPVFGFASVVGASGAVLYTVIACATLMPNARVLFFFVPMPLKVMALILVGLDIFSVLSLRQTSGGTASDVHLAGMALGFFAVRRGWIYFDPTAWWQARREKRVERAVGSDKQRLDQLLERIHRDGIHSLSRRDKDFLSRMSKRG